MAKRRKKPIWVKKAIKKARKQLSRSAAMKASWAKRKEAEALPAIRAPKKAVKRYKTGARNKLGKLVGFSSGNADADTATNAPQTVSRVHDYDTGYDEGLTRPMPGGIDELEKRHKTTLSRVEDLEEQLLQYQQDLIDAVADSEKSRLRLASRIKNLT